PVQGPAARLQRRGGARGGGTRTTPAAAVPPAREDPLMELHERLSTSSQTAGAVGAKDSFAEVKNRVHFAVIGELGPQLFNADMHSDELRERVLADIRRHLTDEPGIARGDREW